MSGLGSGSFNGLTTNVGISQSLLGINGQPVLGQTIFDDQILGSSGMESANQSAGATVSYSGLGGPPGYVSASITLPVSQNISIDLGNNTFLTGSASGTIVMTGFVPRNPEPSSMMIAGIGLASLAVYAHRKLARRRPPAC